MKAKCVTVSVACDRGIKWDAKGRMVVVLCLLALVGAHEDGRRKGALSVPMCVCLVVNPACSGAFGVRLSVDQVRLVLGGMHGMGWDGMGWEGKTGAFVTEQKQQLGIVDLR